MITRGLIALTLLAVLAACGDPGDKAAPSGDASHSSSTSTSSTPTSSTPASSTPASSTPARSTPTASIASTPTGTPFPTAKDGQNYKSCNDGNCEVLVHSKAVITLRGKKYNATVKSGTVRLESGSGYVSLSGYGYVSWSNNGPVYNATLKAAEGDTAILIITSRG